MNFRQTALLFTLVIVVCSFRNSTNENRPARILAQMYDTIKNIRTTQLIVTSIERIDNKYNKAVAEIKVLTHPRKVYFHNRDKKIEILYNSEVAHNKALVKVHTFPYMSLNLDPSGNMMRKNQHYTLHELGFSFIGKSVALTIAKDKDGLNNFKYHGKHQKNGYNCYMLEYENKSYTYVNYTVTEKETASSLASKLCVNDYLLRNRNDLLNDFGILKKGRVLSVPTLYCRRAVLYIDEKLMLPVSINLYDETGLFECYEYENVRINKGFQPNEFNRDFKEYGF